MKFSFQIHIEYSTGSLKIYKHCLLGLNIQYSIIKKLMFDLAAIQTDEREHSREQPLGSSAGSIDHSVFIP